VEVNNSLNIGVQGFQQATERASQAAHEIATQSVSDAKVESTNPDDLVNSLVDLKQAEIDAKANAKVIETASDVLGSILDVKA